MNQSVPNKRTSEAIYQEALLKLEAIAERHKREIDDYLKELDQEKVKKLTKELQA